MSVVCKSTSAFIILKELNAYFNVVSSYSFFGKATQNPPSPAPVILAGILYFLQIFLKYKLFLQ